MARKQGSHSQITGPRVQQAALRLFAQHGYAAVSMRQIANEVGVQVGALYNYTPDKQSLLFDLMFDHMTDLLGHLRRENLSGPADEQLSQFTRFHIRFHLPKPDQVFIAYMELRNLTAENFATIERLRNNYEAALEGILSKGVAEGRFAVPDTKVATKAVIAMLTGLMSWYREGGRLPTAQIEGIYCDLVRKAVSASDLDRRP